MKKNKKISLIGYMGSGKSTIGKFLAKELGIPFLDLDKEIERITSCSISEVFESMGEIKFRKLENETLSKLLKAEKTFVLSTGGGTPVFYDNMEMLNRYSDTVFLNVNLATLTTRLARNKSKRPLIAHLPDEELQEFIAKHLFERNPFYQNSKYTLYIKNESLQKVVADLMTKLNTL